MSVITVTLECLEIRNGYNDLGLWTKFPLINASKVHFWAKALYRESFKFSIVKRKTKKATKIK